MSSPVFCLRRSHLAIGDWLTAMNGRFSNRRGSAQSIVAVYERLAAQCSTVNQLNRLHIQLENRITPEELYLLASTLRMPLFGRLIAQPPRLRFPFHRIKWFLLGLPHSPKIWPFLRPVYSDEWIRGLHKRVAPLHGERPPNQSRRVEGKRSFAWFCRKDVTPRALMVCFPGNQNRMLIQTPILLEALAPLHVDVLLLGSGSRNHFGEGLPGFGPTFEQASRSLASWISSKGYQDIWVFGTSRGALPAIKYGLELKASRIVSVGAAGVEKLTSRQSERISQHGRVSSACIRLVYGENAPHDGRSAFSLRELLPHAEICVIPNAPHAPIWDLMLRDELRDFLKVVFSGERLSDPQDCLFMQIVPSTTASFEEFVMTVVRSASRTNPN